MYSIDMSTRLQPLAARHVGERQNEERDRREEENHVEHGCCPYQAPDLPPIHHTRPMSHVFCRVFVVPSSVGKNARSDQSLRNSPRTRNPSASLCSSVSVTSCRTCFTPPNSPPSSLRYS